MIEILHYCMEREAVAIYVNVGDAVKSMYMN